LAQSVLDEHASFFSDLFPWDGLNFVVLDFFYAAGDFFLSHGFHVVIDGDIEAVDQGGGEIGSLVIGQSQGLLEGFASFHGAIIARAG
jgi:hypothetical protein